jgi:hypothetical protein
MKSKNLLSLFVILFGITTSYSQGITYSTKASSYLDAEFQKSIEIYTMESTDNKNKLDRQSYIDEVANERLLYFLNVIRESTKYNSADVVLDKFSESDDAHRRLCGYPNGGILKEPYNYRYPSMNMMNSDLAKYGLKISGEIYDIEVKLGMTRKADTSYEEIVRCALNDLTSKRLIKWGGKICIVDDYLESPGHKRIIDNRGFGKYGFNNTILVKKYRDQKTGLWTYDVFVMNLTIFTEEI